MLVYLVLTGMAIAVGIAALSLLGPSGLDPAYEAYLALSTGTVPTDVAVYPIIVNGSDVCVAAWEAPTVVGGRVYVGGAEVPVPGYAPRKAAAVWGPCPSR